MFKTMDEDFHQLIGDIYATVADGKRWTLVLNRFARYINAYGCIISEIEGVAGNRVITTPYMSSNFKQENIDAYLSKHSDHEFKDQQRYEMLSKAQDEVDLIREAEIAMGIETDYFARPNIKWLRDIGVAERVGGLLDKDNPTRARFSLQMKQPLNMKAQAKVRPLLHHIAKAIELSRPVRQLEKNQMRLMAGINRLRIGVAILDQFGRVELSNTEFDRQVEAYDAIRVDSDRRLVFREDFDKLWLSRMIAEIENMANSAPARGKKRSPSATPPTSPPLRK